MRHEVQQRHKIHVKAELVTAGTPRTGKTVIATLVRISDGMFWNGTAWVVGPSTFNLAEVDSTNLPGLYRSFVDPDELDMVLGADGYDVRVRCVEFAMDERIHIAPSDETSVAPVVPDEAVPQATVFASHQFVQLDGEAVIVLGVSTYPPVHGKPGAWTLREMVMSVGDSAAGVSDMMSDGFSAPQLVEQASPTDGGHTASVTGDPIFTAGGGPSGEDVYTVPVDDSSGFTVGDFVRAASRPQHQAHVYEIVELPSGTEVVLWAHQDSADTPFGVSDGYTIEEVDPTGLYFGRVVVPVGDYLSLDEPRATMRVVMSTVTTGDGPLWQNSVDLVWVRGLEVDLAGRGYVAG